jgi:hypothetical protein
MLYEYGADLKSKDEDGADWKIQCALIILFATVFLSTVLFHIFSGV